MATALSVQNSEIVYQYNVHILWTLAIDKIKSLVTQSPII